MPEEDEDSDSDSDISDLPDPVDFGEEEEDGSDFILTKNYGSIHLKSAENLLLNGGRTSIGTKSF